MEKVVFNGQVVNDWFEYIELKFSDTKYFEIEYNSEKKDLTVVSKTNESKIIFYNLSDPTYFDELVYCTSEQYGGNCEGQDVKDFDQSTLKLVDDMLDIPINTGWL
jgi:hypothetical protein